MSYWRFVVPDGLSEERAEALSALPGLRVTRGGVTAPTNAAWLAHEYLAGLGVGFKGFPPRAAPPRSARLALPYLREWVPAFLTSYQKAGVQTALAMPGESGHFHWSAGSGKTLGALVWALAAGNRLTVVVTKAAIRGTWAREIETYCQGVEWKVLTGEKPEIPSIDLSAPVILVTGYDTLPAWISILEKLKPTSLVLDEIHHVKSHKRWNAEVKLGGVEGAEVEPVEVVGAEPAVIDLSVPIAEPAVSFSLKENIAAAVYRLSRASRRRLATTATPISDRVRDLWAQLDLIHPWEWGAYWAWAKRYAAAAENPFGGMEDKGKSNLGELKRRLSYVSHKVPYSLANRSLPPKRRLVTYLKVSEQVRPEPIAAEIKAALKNGPTAILEMRLMEAASRKRKIVLAHARDALEARLKVIIFTGRRKDCDRLAEDAAAWIHLGGRGIAPSALAGLRIWKGTGADSAEARDQMREEYMAAAGPALLIGTGDAWGEGLNLQDTDLLIQAMLPYTPRQIIQREGRVARLGQKRPVLIRYLICEGTVDEHVASILLKKLPAVEQVTEGDETLGLGRELIGESEENLIQGFVAKLMGTEAGGETK
jgi:superfamily II DNA or RNA helicase